MKTLGLIGGMSWESTATYYRLLNEGVKQLRGGFHSARILLHSVDFAEYEELLTASDWQRIGEKLAGIAADLERGGAEILMICTNTMHKVAPTVAGRVSIPLLHIADAAAEAIRADGLDRVGLLGTRFTMEDDFYQDRLERHFGLEVLVPDAVARQEVDRIIFEELCLGKIKPSSRQTYRLIVEELGRRGAQGVILGCTEISLLLGPEDTSLALYDTTALHAAQGVRLMLG